jgi:hypothetical protein
MFWMLRQEWPSGAWFTFNCYRHWAILVVCGENSRTLFVYSKEGVTQGYPLVMAVYGILLLPLICQLKREIPDVNQPWYMLTMLGLEATLATYAGILNGSRKSDPPEDTSQSHQKVS